MDQEVEDDIFVVGDYNATADMTWAEGLLIL